LLIPHHSFLIPHSSFLPTTNGACDIPIFRDYQLSLLASHFLFLIPSSTNYLLLSHSSPLIPHSYLLPMELATSRIFGTINYRPVTCQMCRFNKFMKYLFKLLLFINLTGSLEHFLKRTYPVNKVDILPTEFYLKCYQLHILLISDSYRFPKLFLPDHYHPQMLLPF